MRLRVDLLSVIITQYRKAIMVVGCGAKILKFLLFTFNLIFFIAGAISLGIGLWFIFDQKAGYAISNVANDYNISNTGINDIYKTPVVVRDVGILLAAGGGLVFVISFFGCCGALKEWRTLLVLYAVCLVIIFCVEIAGAVYIYLNRDSVEGDIKNGLHLTLKQFYNNTDNTVKKSWDNFMKENRCCGISSNGTNDFQGTDWSLANPSKPYPDVCCNVPPCTQLNRYQGCFDVVSGELSSQIQIVIGIGIGVGLLQIFGIIFSCCLCTSIDKNSRSV